MYGFFDTGLVAPLIAAVGSVPLRRLISRVRSARSPNSPKWFERYPAIQPNASSGEPCMICAKLFWKSSELTCCATTFAPVFFVNASLTALAILSPVAPPPRVVQRTVLPFKRVEASAEPAASVLPATRPSPPTAAPLSNERRETEFVSSDIFFLFS